MRVERRSIELFALAALIVASCAARESTVRHSDGTSSTGAHVHGLRDGHWIERYPSGQKQSEGEYRDDVQTGAWSYWFENGRKEMEGRFVDERRDGEWKQWYESGALRAEGRFERGFEEGPWRFYDGNGALEREGCFDLGKPVLRWNSFGAGGTVRATGNYFAGVKVGEWSERDAAGNPTIAVYPLPADCELFEERFADAAIKRAGFLRGGTPVGRWNSAHPSGKLRLECGFENGAPNGRARAWRDDGSLLASGPLKDGCIAGDWTFARGESSGELHFDAPRPRQAFAGEWSSASSADLPGSAAVETWIAEICSPRQPPPVRVERATPSAKSSDANTASTISGIPARAQPWTEYDIGELPALLELYGAGRTSGAHDEDDWSAPVLRETRPKNISTPTNFVGRPLPWKHFITADGVTLDLDAFVGKRNVLVTVLRGFGGQVCVYCAAQTKGLADFAEEFAASETEVVVVYPGPASGLDAFRDAYRRTFGADEKVPYKLLYDTDLAFTRALHIEDNIAVPTSLLLDKKGIVRWCHVAKNYSDRPSARSVLDEIATIRKTQR